MGLFDRFLGGKQEPAPQLQGWGRNAAAGDDQAIERYRYLLRTASPETVEQTHAEAFAKLTPEQRRRVLDELSAELPEAERTCRAEFAKKAYFARLVLASARKRAKHAKRTTRRGDAA